MKFIGDKIFREVALLLGLATIPALATALFHPNRSGLFERPPAIEQVDATKAAAWGRSVLWIDARPRKAFDVAHIPGAVPLNEDTWDELLPGFLSSWEPGTKTVVYCSSQSCAASESVAARLEKELKLENVFVLKGGWEAWRQTQH